MKQANNIAQRWLTWIPWIMLFIVSFTILLMGFNGLFSLLPDAWGNYDGDGYFTKYKEFVPTYVSFFVVAGGFWLFFSMRKKIYLFQDILQLIVCSNPDLIEKMECVRNGTYGGKTDIPLSLILKHLHKFDLLRGKPYEYDNTCDHNALDKACRYFPSEIGKGINNLSNNLLYLRMCTLDNVLMKNMKEIMVDGPDPEKLYYLRFNLLSDFMNAFLNGKKLILDRGSSSREEESVFVFCKNALFEYYRFSDGDKEYKIQPGELNLKEFRAYMRGK